MPHRVVHLQAAARARVIFPPQPQNLSTSISAILGLTCQLVTSSPRRRHRNRDYEDEARARHTTLKKYDKTDH